MLPRFRLPHPTRDRRLIAATLLLVAAASGISFSVPRPIVKDLSTPFPCMNGHACSCRDAEMCWRQCGCFSDDQKLAWAAEHGVTPPVWFAALRPARPTDAEPVAGCCRSADTTPCCEAETDDRPCFPAEVGQRGCQPLERLFVLMSLVLPVESKPAGVVLTAGDRLGRIGSDFYLGTGAVPPQRPPESVSG